MNTIEKRIFELYEIEINDMHCAKCFEQDHKLEMTSSGKRKRCGPVSFWNLGENLEIKTNSVGLAFVGKTSWMTPDDLAVHSQVGRVYDVREEIDYFFGHEIKRYRYWRCIKKISNEVYSSEDRLFLKNVFITNLVKCNVYEKQQNKYTNITDWDYFDACVDIFEKEIKVVRPTHIIFFTNSYYDSLIELMRFGYSEWEDCTTKGSYKEIAMKEKTRCMPVCWWHRIFFQNGKPMMHFLRTRHPQGAPRYFEDEIAQWIKAERVTI